MQYRIWIHLVLAIFVAWFDVLNAKLGSKEFMACGGLSTAITDLLLFPLDTIKVTQQSSKQLMTSSEAFKQILNSGGGAAALYKGAIGYATMDGVGAALFFAVYERVKRYTIEDLHLSGPCLSASVYGAAAAAFGVSSIVLVPAELIKARMQTQAFRSIGLCLKDAVAMERGGLRGLYTGYAATMVRDLPYFALQLGFYDNIKDFLTARLQRIGSDREGTSEHLHHAKHGASGFFQKELHLLRNIRLNPPVIDLLSGISAGFLTGLLTNPMDVVTARLMTQKADIAKGLLPGFRASVGAPYRGFGDCVLRMAREEGPRSFLIGVKSRVGWIAPFTAISLGLNNVLRRRAESLQALQGKEDEP